MSIDKSEDRGTNREVARSTGVIALGTLCSRVLGFFRDIVIARLFGIQIYAQAFVVAFKIPNLLRDFLGEGAANSAFVPVFSEYAVKHTKEEFWELANIVLNVLLIVLSAVTLLGIIFSPLIVRLIAPGFIVSPEKLEATVKLTRIIFPYLIFISLAAYSMGILNSLKHFSVPAFAPSLLNISIIACAFIWGEGITGLASGILVGGVLQLAVQIPVLYKKGFRFRFTRRFNHPAARTIFKLMLPRIASTSIYQLNNFVDTIFGSLAFIVGEGGVAVLYFAYRLVLFPLGIFSTALSQAILPTFSRQALEDNLGKLKNTLSFGLGNTFFVMLPASVAFMVLSRLIISGLFQGGRFDLNAVNTTSSVLFFYSLGLFAYGGTKVVNSCFFALKDTVTPTKIAVLSLILNIVFNSILMFPMKLNGLALATSLSGIIAFVVSFIRLEKKLGGLAIKPIVALFFKLLLASLGMGLVCFLSMQLRINLGNNILDRIASLLFPILSGLTGYLLFCFLLGVEQIQQVARLLTQRKL